MLEGMKIALEKHEGNDNEEKLDINDKMETLENKVSEIYDLLTKLTNTIKND